MVLGLQDYLRTVVIYLSHAPVNAHLIFCHDLLVVLLFIFFFFLGFIQTFLFLASSCTLKQLTFWYNIILILIFIITIKYFLIASVSQHTKRMICSPSLFQFAAVGRKLTSIHWPCSLGYLNPITLNFKGNLLTSFPSLTLKIVLLLFYHKCLQIGKATCLTFILSLEQNDSWFSLC